MSWWMVDDGATQHPKLRAAGLFGRALWFATGPLVAQVEGDGFIPPITLKDAFHHAEIDKPKQKQEGLAGLVRNPVGPLWHDHETIRECPECLERVRKLRGGLEEGWHFYHDWWKCNGSKKTKDDPLARRLEHARNKLARLPTLRDAVRSRDMNLCRYCGELTVWNDRRSRRAGTYDHVNPFLSTLEELNAPKNLVVACKACNERKGQRTPDQAEMPLRPVPQQPDIDASAPSSREIGSRTDLERTSRDDQEISRENLERTSRDDPKNLERPSRTREGGPGQVGSRSDLDRIWNGPGDVGSDEDGPGKDGSGEAGPGEDGWPHPPETDEPPA